MDYIFTTQGLKVHLKGPSTFLPKVLWKKPTFKFGSDWIHQNGEAIKREVGIEQRVKLPSPVKSLISEPSRNPICGPAEVAKWKCLCWEPFQNSRGQLNIIHLKKNSTALTKAWLNLGYSIWIYDHYGA